MKRSRWILLALLGSVLLTIGPEATAARAGSSGSQAFTVTATDLGGNTQFVKRSLVQIRYTFTNKGKTAPLGSALVSVATISGGSPGSLSFTRWPDAAIASRADGSPACSASSPGGTPTVSWYQGQTGVAVLVQNFNLQPSQPGTLTCDSTGPAVTMPSVESNCYSIPDAVRAQVNGNFTGGTSSSALTLQTAQSTSCWKVGPPTAPATFTLTVRVAGSGSVSSTDGNISNCTSTCTANYTEASPAPQVTLNASPATGWQFSSWTQASGTTDCAGSTSTSCTVTMNSNKGETANFSQKKFGTTGCAGQPCAQVSPGHCSDTTTTLFSVAFPGTCDFFYTMYDSTFGGEQGRFCSDFNIPPAFCPQANIGIRPPGFTMANPIHYFIPNGITPIAAVILELDDHSSKRLNLCTGFEEDVGCYSLTPAGADVFLPSGDGWILGIPSGR